MHVALYAPYAIYTPHFETDLELAQRHIVAGDRVTILVCDRALEACDINAFHVAQTCRLCESRRRQGLAALSTPFETVQLGALIRGPDPVRKALPASCSSVAELRALRVEDFDLGYAVLSSLVSMLRDPEPDVQAHRALVRRLILAGYDAYRAVQRFLDVTPIDRMYVYNGRYAPLRAAFRACESRSVECVTHERGSSVDRFALFPNVFPQDLGFAEQAMRRAWASAEGNHDRQAIAAGFFERRMQGETQNWHSFVTDQQPGMLPVRWSSAATNIVAFTTSEDEFVALGDLWRNPIYTNQLVALRRIIEDLFAQKTPLHLTIRMHPNLRNAHPALLEATCELESERVTVVRPDSPVSTYALARAADRVLTFGSTMGIEACYLRKPSVLAGRSMYEGLGGTYNAKTHDEVLSLLRSDLEPRSQEAALMYGYYVATYGERFRYFNPSGLFDGTFLGAKIEPTQLDRMAMDIVGRRDRVIQGLRRRATQVVAAPRRRLRRLIER